MLILGQTTDEVGTNLERLTKRLLEHLGHGNTVINQVGSGGEEVDVVSDYLIPMPGGNKTRRVITECKAYRTPVDMTTWLKFLGKVYVEEAKLGTEVTGLFIALSGVNGNVSGNYDELKTKRDSISLISGAVLHAELSNIYSFPELNQVIAKLQSQTDRKHLSIELAYFNENFYWAASFQDQAYTLLDLTGSALKTEDVVVVRPLLEKRLAVQTFIDLSQEAKLKERQLQLSKLILALLFQSGGEGSKTDLVSSDLGFVVSELEESFQQLSTGGLLHIEGDRIALAFDRATDRINSFAQCVLFLLRGQLKVETVCRVLLAEHFKQQLTEEFINHISNVQRGLVIPAADRGLILMVVASSPSALAYCLMPDPLIVTHREHQPGVGGELSEANDYSTFKRSILDALASDFGQQELRSFYLEGLGLVEIETVKRVVLKSAKETTLDQEVIERRGLARAAPDIGGGIIPILIFDQAPQPWQPGGIGYVAPPAPPAPVSAPAPAESISPAN